MKQYLSALAKINVVLILLVILAGSIVRSTQSGMGCPDWPKCYGLFIPPTHIDQLPQNYKQIYAHQGIPAEDFDAVKTWIEYINRLLGAILGITVFLQLLSSLYHWKQDKTITLLSIAIFLLTGFQGWLGALVVASNLAPLKITIHMLMAMALLLLGTHIAWKPKIISDNVLNNRLSYFIGIGIIAVIIQILLGTQVRQEIDQLAKALNYTQRDIWISNLSSIFSIHRSFAHVILLIHAYFLYVIFKSRPYQSSLKTISFSIGIILLLEISAGVILNYMDMPAYIQPVHLLLASILLCLDYILFLKSKPVKA
jgi:heme a synthase